MNWNVISEDWQSTFRNAIHSKWLNQKAPQAVQDFKLLKSNLGRINVERIPRCKAII